MLPRDYLCSAARNKIRTVVGIAVVVSVVVYTLEGNPRIRGRLNSRVTAAAVATAARTSSNIRERERERGTRIIGISRHCARERARDLVYQLYRRWFFTSSRAMQLKHIHTNTRTSSPNKLGERERCTRRLFSLPIVHYSSQEDEKRRSVEVERGS